mgnify:CR=1 FL=1
MTTSTIPAMLSKSDLAKYIGFTTRTVDRMVDRGDLPPPRRSSSGAKRWLRSEVDAAISQWPRDGSTDVE